MNSIEKLLNVADTHPALKKQLEQNKDISCLEDCALASPEIAIIASARHDYSAGGGVARHSILRVLYKDAFQTEEWQYCDKYSHSCDRRDLMILKIGKTEVKQQGGKIEIWIECIPPKEYSPRRVNFRFNKKEDREIVNPSELSDGDQSSFVEWVEQEQRRILDTMLDNWKNNGCTMPSPHGRLPYSQPRIKEVKLNKAIGVGVIITEEQIDFDTRGNPQIQQWAVILKWDGKVVKMAHEEHAYTTEGSPNIDIISVSPKDVIFGTQNGKLTIKV
jgi:hypothetical protein